jgi:hypothetical protein
VKLQDGTLCAIIGLAVAQAGAAHAQQATPAVAPADQNVTRNATPATLTPFFSLQSDFNNLPLVPNPSCTACQAGALVSAKFDELAKTTSAVVDGTVFAGGIYSSSSGLHVVFGGFFQSEGTNQFATGSMANKASDLLTPGGFIQMDFQDPIFDRTQSIRLRSGDAFASSGTRNATTVLEWQPHLPARATQFPLGYWVEAAWAPELMIQYDHLVGGPATYAIFRSHDQALRIGPQVSLSLYCNAFRCAADSWASKLALTVTGHVSGDALGDRGYGFVQTMVSYQLTPIFGLSASYGYGDADATGNAQSQIKLGLSVKYSAASP